MKTNMRVIFLNGLCILGRIPFTRRFLDIQLFSPVRERSDGITFFKFEIKWDRWEGEHMPQFSIELTVLNLYNMFMIHT